MSPLSRWERAGVRVNGTDKWVEPSPFRKTKGARTSEASVRGMSGAAAPPLSGGDSEGVSEANPGDARISIDHIR